MPPRLPISDAERRLRKKEVARRYAQNARDNKKNETAEPIVRELLTEEQKLENRRIVVSDYLEKRREKAALKKNHNKENKKTYDTHRSKIQKWSRENQALKKENKALKASLKASQILFTDDGVLRVQSIVGNITFEDMLKVLKENSVEGVAADLDPNNSKGK
jgi:hypothetical protein